MSLLFETKRLQIRPWTLQDLPHYLALANDVGHTAFSLPGQFPTDSTEATARIKDRIELFETKKVAKFLLLSKETGEAIGTCGLGAYEIAGQEEMELGFRLGLQHWNKGYATEASLAILRHSFNELNLKKVVAFAVPQNLASNRVIEKLGFQYLKDFLHANIPHKLYELTKESFLKTKSSDDPSNEKLSKAIQLGSEKRPEAALTLLLELLQEMSDDPQVNYQTAWTYDSMGKEREAVSHYEKAIEIGLSGDDLKSALLGLGSTYRCLGEYKKSLATFDKAISNFPNDRALRVFRALTLYNLGKFSDSTSELLTQLADTTSNKDIKSYERALRFYSDKLDKVWK